MEEDRKVWTKQEVLPASYIEELECQMMTDNKTDTEWVNPICYRRDIIDKAEMEAMTPKEKGPTMMFIGMLKTESNWADLTVKQRI
eukprot:7683924-Heterocapsa_arctica.AAC.1